MYYPIIDKLKEVMTSINTDIIEQSYSTSQSWSSGTIGTRGAQGLLNVYKDGYKVIGCSVSYIANSNYAIVVPFMSNDRKTVYCNFYRADSSSHSDVEAAVSVIYKKV